MENKITDTPVISTVSIPGKISARCISVNLAKPGEKNNSVKIKNKTRAKIIKSSGQILEQFRSIKYVTPYIDPEFVRLAFESNPEHTRCIKFKSNCIIGGGVDITPVDPEYKNYTNDSEYKLLEDFLNNPINDMDEYFIDVFKAAVEDYCNFGFGLIECVKNVKGSLGELYYFPAYTARIAYNNDLNVQLSWKNRISILQLVWNYQANEFSIFSDKTFKEKERSILWLKNINPFDRFYGFPEWIPATAKLALSRSIDEYNIRSFKNDLMVSFAIIVEGGDLGDGQESQITEFLQANYKGIANANRALYLNSDRPDVKIRIEKVQKDGKESSYIQTLSENSQSIIIAHGVIASLLGISKAGKLGNTSENYDLFQVMNETIVKPEQNKIANKINGLMKIGLGISKFKLIPKELTFEKLTEMVKYSKDLTDSGIIDKNEARTYLGYEPLDENNTNLQEQVASVAKQVRLIKQELDNE